MTHSGEFTVSSAGSAAEAIEKLASEEFDVLLVDLGLPDQQGIATVSTLRDKTVAPILIVSGSASGHERAEALEAGADDFVPKPFFPEELVARVKVALRHASAAPRVRELDAGDLKICTDEHRVLIGEEEIRLTKNEHRLLLLLAGDLDHVVTTETLLDELWGERSPKNEQHLRVLVAYVRRKIETDPASPEYLITEHGVGYRLRRPARTRLSRPAA